MKRALIILYLLLYSFFAQSKGIEQHTSIDKTKIILGERITYTITVKTKLNEGSVIFPILPDTFNHFELIETKKLAEKIVDNTTTYSQEFVLTHFDSGRWVIPPFRIKYVPTNGVAEDVETDSLSVEVNTVKVILDQPIRDIHGADSEGITVMKIITIVGIALALFLIIYSIFWYIKYRNKKHEAAWQSALRQLEELNIKKAWLQDPKTFCASTSNILRNYLQEHLHVPAKDKPTNELIPTLAIHPITTPHAKILADIFNYTDMVKFAKAQLNTTELEAIAQNALAFVQKTYPLMFENKKEE